MAIDVQTDSLPADWKGNAEKVMRRIGLSDEELDMSRELKDALTNLTPEYSMLEMTDLAKRGIPPDFGDRLLYFFGRSFDLAPELVGAERPDLAEIVRQKLTANLGEATAFYKSNPFTTHSLREMNPAQLERLRKDWDTIIFSFDAVRQVAVASRALEEGNSRRMELYRNPNMPLEMVLNFFDFSGRNPKLVNIYQSMMEFVWVQQMLYQASDDQYKDLVAKKSKFYQLYNAGNEMNKSVPTTDATRDIARAVNLVQRYGEKGQPIDVLFLGVGNGQRFEPNFLLEMEKRGSSFRLITGIDLNDRSNEFPEILKSRMRDLVIGDLADPHIDLKGKYSLLVAPWSIMTDMVDKRSLIYALLAIADASQNCALFLTDDPEPLLSDVAYGPMIRQQLEARGVYGIVEKPFQAGDAQILTLLNVMSLPEWTLLKAGAGFLPVNVPFDRRNQNDLLAKWVNKEDRLRQDYQTGADTQAQEAVWMPKEQPRSTVLSRKVDETGLLEATGLTPSVLFSVFRHFRSSGKSQAENAL